MKISFEIIILFILYMENKTKLFIFILLVIVHVSLDNTLDKCKNIYGKLSIIIHHLGGIYLVLGSLLFGYHLFHFILVFLVIILYNINDGCFLTTWTNKFCKFDDKELFKTLFNKIFKEDIKTIRMLNIFVLSIILLYDLYYINKEYKFIKI